MEVFGINMDILFVILCSTVLGAFLHYSYTELYPKVKTKPRVCAPSQKDYLQKYGNIVWLSQFKDKLLNDYGITLKVTTDLYFGGEVFELSKGDVWQAKTISSLLIKENPELVKNVLYGVALWVENTYNREKSDKSKPEICD